MDYLRPVPSRRPRRRMTLPVVTLDENGPATKLAASTVNRILAAVSSFCGHAILPGLWGQANPRVSDPAVVVGCHWAVDQPGRGKGAGA